MPGGTHLFLIARPVGHLQILIQEVQAQLTDRRFKEVVLHEAREKTDGVSTTESSCRATIPWLCWQGRRHSLAVPTTALSHGTPYPRCSSDGRDRNTAELTCIFRKLLVSSSRNLTA